MNVSSCHKCRKKLVTDGTRRAFLGYFQGPRWGSWAREDEDLRVRVERQGGLFSEQVEQDWEMAVV